MNLVAGQGVEIHVFQIDGHAQEALHAVHMDDRAAVHQLVQARNVQLRAGLVVHLHAADEAHAVVQRLLKHFPVRLAALVYADHPHLMALSLQLHKALPHRRVLHGAHRHELLAPHAAHRAQYGKVVGLRAAGGEHQIVLPRVQRL